MTCSVAQKMAKTFSPTPFQCLQGLQVQSSLDKTTSSPFDDVDFNERVDIFFSSESLVETPTKPSAKVWVSGGQLWYVETLLLCSMFLISTLIQMRNSAFPPLRLLAKASQGCAARPRRVVHFDGLKRSASDVS